MVGCSVGVAMTGFIELSGLAVAVAVALAGDGDGTTGALA
jgi:hypothetical protein